MTDGKYFTTDKNDEIFELKAALNSDERDKKCAAMTKILASSIIGKDMSALFPDVVNCVQTDIIELKKLVYLYLRDYSKTNPDMAILSMNTFLKDCEDLNPFIRTLALRTMSNINLEKATEYLCEPLRKCLRDQDTYVRKTAADCVAQLYNKNPQLVHDQGFLEQLKELLSDSNSMVVSNTVTVLTEMSETNATGYPLIELNSQIVNTLLTSLNECTEWGQVFILDSLVNYNPKDDCEAQSICEKITPQLTHANSAVVLSTIKVLMKLMDILPTDSDFVFKLIKNLSLPLVTLLSMESEIQYVALMNINVLVKKKPDILKCEIKVFFVKYNDPIFIKLVKLDILICLASQENILQILSEFKEYATDVDVDFVCKVIQAIGQCAIKLEKFVDDCVVIIVDLIQTKVNYVVQEAVIVIKDIFRKYSNLYDNTISVLCENLDSLDKSEVKASMIWIIGEYSEHIDNADGLLKGFLKGFHDEHFQVQLQLLTAIVKIFLKQPTDTLQLVQQVLKMATEDSDNPDLRDRGLFYWRILSTVPRVARDVVLAKKLLISNETNSSEPTLIDEILRLIPSFASNYHKPQSALVQGKQRFQTSLPTIYENVSSNNVLQYDNISISQEVLIEDLPSMNLTTPAVVSTSTQPSSVNNLLTPKLDALLKTSDLQTASTSSTVGHDFLFSTDLTTSSVQLPFDDLPASELNLFLNTSDLSTASSIEDLHSFFLNMDLTTPAVVPLSVPFIDLQAPGEDMLFENSDLLTVPISNTEFFDNLLKCVSVTYSPPKKLWLACENNIGLDIMGTFSRKNGQINMDMTLINNSVDEMTGFIIQLNKNVFGLTPVCALQVLNPLLAKDSIEITLPLKTSGVVQRMEPITNLQIAMKTSIGIVYYACIIPINVLFVEDGEMNMQVYLATWKDIPAKNEVQFTLKSGTYVTDVIIMKMFQNNVFSIAKRTVEDLDIVYQSLKLTNGNWVLSVLKFQPGNPIITLSLKSHDLEVVNAVFHAYNAILQS